MVAACSILLTVHSKLSVWTAQKRTRLVAEKIRFCAYVSVVPYEGVRYRRTTLVR